MVRTKEQMRAYQKERRAKKKVGTSECSNCKVLMERIKELEEAAKPVKTSIDTPKVIKTKDDAKKIVTPLVKNTLAHHPSCKCFQCKPPKE